MHQGNVLTRAQARRIVRLRLRPLLGGGLRSRLDASRMAGKLTSRSYVAGDVIIRRGVRGDLFGVVTHGRLAVVRSGPTNQRRDTRQAHLVPGQAFGEWMLIGGEPSSSTVRALSDSEIAFVRRADFLEVAGARVSGSSGDKVRRGHWWLVALLLLVTSLTLAAFAQTELLSPEPRDGERALSGMHVLAEGVATFITPQDGTILQRADALPVRVQVLEPGFLHAELEADGIQVGSRVNPDPEATSWTIEWAWEGVSDGAHTLAVELRDEKGELFASSPVTVTLVPAGQLLFASNRDGADAIYSMPTDGRRVQLLSRGSGNARLPTLRKDGLVAFLAESEGRGDVIRCFDAGDEDTWDFVHGRDPAWSPNGDHMAYASSVDGVSQVFVADASGREVLQVTEERIYAGQPAWSPDGTRLAYVAERDQNWDVWLVALDGSEPQRVTNDPAMDWGPDWSPDGESLAFVSDRMDGHQVYVSKTDGADLRRLTDFDQGAESPSWAPDGDWLAFVAYTGTGEGVHRRELYVMRYNGEDQTRLTDNAFDETDPVWDPQR